MAGGRGHDRHRRRGDRRRDGCLRGVGPRGHVRHRVVEPERAVHAARRIAERPRRPRRRRRRPAPARPSHRSANPVRCWPRRRPGRRPTRRPCGADRRGPGQGRAGHLLGRRARRRHRQAGVSAPGGQGPHPGVDDEAAHLGRGAGHLRSGAHLHHLGGQVRRATGSSWSVAATPIWPRSPAPTPSPSAPRSPIWRGPRRPSCGRARPLGSAWATTPPCSAVRPGTRPGRASTATR